jgi:hypothetical protein
MRRCEVPSDGVNLLLRDWDVWWLDPKSGAKSIPGGSYYMDG